MQSISQDASGRQKVVTGGANFARLIYPYVSSSGSHLTGVMAGLKLDRPWLASRIYDCVLLFVCLARVNTSERKKKRGRRRRENLQKYIFLITVAEVNAAYLGAPTDGV